MTTLQVAALVVDAGLALATLAWGVAKLALRRRAKRRWAEHSGRCGRCYPVLQSDGPTWLLCEEGRALGAAATGHRWCSLADVLQESAGVPTERRN